MAADIPLNLVDGVRIASPCPMRWDRMEGDGPVRHCRRCDLDVYDFEHLSGEEIVELLRVRSNGARLCARIYRRPDGTILTRDCPVGLRAARLKVAALGSKIAAVLALLVGTGLRTDAVPLMRLAPRLRYYQPFALIRDALTRKPRITQTTTSTFTMGVVISPEDSGVWFQHSPVSPIPFKTDRTPIAPDQPGAPFIITTIPTTPCPSDAP